MHTPTQIETKIQRLLRLAAGNANIHEAAAAFAQAQALADRHAIDLESMRVERENAGEKTDAPESSNAPISKIVVDAPGRTRIRWRIHLAMAVASANGARVYSSAGVRGDWPGRRSAIVAYGPADRLDLVRTLYHWIATEIDRMGAEFARGRGRDAGRSFRNGAVDEVSRRLRDERAKTLESAKTDAYQRGGETALAVVSTAIARQDREKDLQRYARKIGLVAGSALSAGRSASAYAAGRAAGRTVSTSPSGSIGGR